MPTSSRVGGPARPSKRRQPRTGGQAQPLASVRRDAPGRVSVAVVPRPTVSTATPAATFAELGVPSALVAALAAQGCHVPLPIQAATLPTALAGRDVLGRARTGSGKTIGFAVPTVVAVAASGRARRPGMPRALVLVPTRELAAQVTDVMTPLVRAMRLSVAKVHGGVGQSSQVAALRHGVDVLVATPGRLEDLISQRLCDLGAVEVTVLDEADHMADLGFLPAVKRLLDRTPARCQRLLFSATLDGAVDILVQRYLHDPVVHSVDAVVSTPPELDHYAFTVQPRDKAAVVKELASGRERSLLFTRTKHAAKKLAGDLSRQGIPAVDLHGNLSQARRERNLAAFATGSARVLVATDIAARGIHVDDVSLVVHVDPPTEHKAYLHRSGRTARAGARGAVVTLVLPDQAREVNSMIRQAGIRPTPVRIAPGAAETVALTGPPAALVASPPPPSATAVAGRPRLSGPTSRQRRRRR